MLRWRSHASSHPPAWAHSRLGPFPLGPIPAWAIARAEQWSACRGSRPKCCTATTSSSLSSRQVPAQMWSSHGADVVESRRRCGVRWVPFASRGAEYGASRCAVGEADGGADGRLTAGADGRAAQDDGGAAGLRRPPLACAIHSLCRSLGSSRSVRGRVCLAGGLSIGWCACACASAHVCVCTYEPTAADPEKPTGERNRKGLVTVAHARAWRPRRSRLEEYCIEVGVLSFGSAAVDSAAGRHRDWTVLGVEPGSTGRRCAFTAHRNCYNHSAASVRPMPCKPGQNVCQGYG